MIKEYPAPSKAEIIAEEIRGWLYVARCMVIGIFVGWRTVFETCAEWCCCMTEMKRSKYLWRYLAEDEMFGEGWRYILKYW